MNLVSCAIYKTHAPDDGQASLSEKTAKKQGLHYFLPRSKMLIKGAYVQTKDKDGKVVSTSYNVSVSEVRRADPDAPQFAEITENIMYDEDTTLKVDKGLLTSSVAKPKDQTPEIIKTVAGAALDLAKLGPNPFSFKSFKLPLAVPKHYKPFSVEIDPFVQSSITAALKKMNAAGWSLEVTGNASKRDQAAPGPETLAAKTGKTGSRKLPGLVYRRPTPVMFTITSYGDYTAAEGTEINVPDRPEFILPDPTTIAYMPVRRGFMTQRVTTVTFVEGMPSEIALTQPSPVLAFVKLPADIIKMVGEALPAIIKVNTPAASPTDLDLLKAQNALLEQKIKQIEFETKLSQLQSSTSTP